LHDSGIDAVGGAARLGAQDIGLRNWEIVTEIRDIEVVLDSQRDSVVQRDVQLAIVNQVLKARAVPKINRRRFAGR
jgi:hypothetical protein